MMFEGIAAGSNNFLRRSGEQLFRIYQAQCHEWILGKLLLAFGLLVGSVPDVIAQDHPSEGMYCRTSSECCGTSRRNNSCLGENFECINNACTSHERAGESCQQGGDCLSGVCENGVCQRDVYPSTVEEGCPPRYHKTCNALTHKCRCIEPLEPELEGCGKPLDQCPFFGKTCVNGKCEAPRENGEPCSETVQCATGQYCNKDKPSTCVSLAAPAEECTGSGTCASGRCEADSEGKKKCVEYGNQGDLCGPTSARPYCAPDQLCKLIDGSSPPSANCQPRIKVESSMEEFEVFILELIQ